MAIKNEHILKGLEQFKQDFDYNKLLVTLSQVEDTDNYSRNFLVVYGSLREGEYNYKRIRNNFGKDSFFPICERDITYAQLYDLGDYPAVVVAGWGNIVKGQIMYCNDKVFDTLEEMELGAGFSTANMRIYDRENGIDKTVVIPYYVAGVKLANMIRTNPKKYPLVKSGNWSEYLRNVIEA